MPNVVRLPTKSARQPKRPHYVEAWAKLNGYDKPIRLAEALNVSRGQITHWYKGTSPGEDAQQKLAALFGIKPSDLFSHPEDVWFSHFIQGRTPAEVERIKQGLEVNFPRLLPNKQPAE